MEQAPLLHVKLNFGQDILAYGQVVQDGKAIVLTHPVSISVDPISGIFATSWMMFSESDSVTLPQHKVMFVGKANQKAIDYYNEFSNSLKKPRAIDDDEDLEEIFDAIADSKGTTIH